ncbi:CHASE2 domain-containing protein [Nostoc sp. FACHB-280]|uniref:CHASE2 domain-containing protein n=1 Tax=Nostoc sp. FACHB-280 TaxID=2692839 RepID=UPI0028C4F1C3|nr:CHASE2 domain-containing protein [Nostoc sp. FACHB-280]
MTEPNVYTVGGTVQAGGGIYIPRQADIELLNLCRTGTFAYVLTPRQMGKSSLMVRTAESLVQEGVTSVIVDLQELGTQVTAEQWYFGFLVNLEDKLMLDTDVVSWWQTHTHLGVSQRLTLFFEQVLLAEVEGQVVIFVDEIDSTLSLNFTDDFFIAIRYLYTSRATNPELQRLSFVLLGVATPGDLIRDAKRTPFNIGQRVDLTDFTFEEALPLANGLGVEKDEAQEVLRWVLKWTGGHPYLTQRLCRSIKDIGKSKWSESEVDRVVHNIFFDLASKQDSNLQFVRDMLIKRSPNLFAVLSTYKEILLEEDIIYDEEQSLIKSHLKLTGIVRTHKGRLFVSNLIYSKVFNYKWLKENLPSSFKELKAQTVVLTSLVITLLSLVMRQLGVLQSWELKAYDQMLRSRPPEPPDPRLLIVTITEEDLAKFKWQLSDATINQLLTKLESYQPRVIGLNIYRQNQKNLAAGIANKNNIITTCLFSSTGIPETPPPSNFSIDNVGYNNLLSDNQVDQIVRRALLFAEPSNDSKCNTNFSFAALVAISYLEQQGINVDFTNKYSFHLGNITFPILTANSGSYISLDAAGYQILLNYRPPDRLAQAVTLSQVLNNQVNPNWVKDKLVIIGTTAASVHPGVYTPYSASQNQPARMSTVFIHAQIASQILSTVLDGRPLIWYWPEWGVFLWIWCWSLIGSVLAWRLKRLFIVVVTGGFLLVCLISSCSIFMLQAGWIPLIPAALSLVGTIVSLAVSQLALQRQQRLKISKLLINKLEIACKLRGEDMTNVVARLITEYIEHNEVPANITNQKSQERKD